MKLSDDKIFKYVFYHYESGDELIVRFDTSSYGEMIEQFKAFSLACGYCPATVQSYLEPELFYERQIKAIQDIRVLLEYETNDADIISNIKDVLEALED